MKLLAMVTAAGFLTGVAATGAALADALNCTGYNRIGNTITLDTPVGVPTLSAPIPEATAWAMMALGFAGLGFADYRSGRKDRLAPAFS
jgi:hypothetical protein